MASLTFAFAAPVLRLDNGFRYHYLPLPDDVAAAYEAAGVRRLLATLNGLEIRRALQRRDGDPCLIVGISLLREIGAGYGDTVTVALRPDPAPDAVDLGPEFEAALDQDEQAAERFYAMTPGRQRSLASYVTSAKREETRIKRALALARKLRTHTLYGGGHPEKR